MDFTKFLKIKKDLNKLLGKIENGALKSGKDISSEEFKTYLQNIKVKTLENLGINPQEYFQIEKSKPRKSELVDVLEGFISKTARTSVDQNFEKINQNFKEHLTKVSAPIENLEKQIKTLEKRELSWEDIKNRPVIPKILPMPKIPSLPDFTPVVERVNILSKKTSSLDKYLTGHKIEEHPKVKITTEQLNELVSGKEITLHKHKEPFRAEPSTPSFAFVPSRWGSIAGSLSEQRDLQTALDNRALMTFIAVTSNHTLTINDSMIAINASATPITITLPSAVGISGRTYTLKRIDDSGNLVRVIGVNGQTIDREPHMDILFQNTSFGVVSSGVNWQII